MGNTLQEIHAVQLSLLEACRQICGKYQIPFYLAQGTLLGAVRHQGFIPWDDDIDLLFQADDLARFVEAFHREQPPGITLEHCRENPYTPYPWVKLKRQGTTSMPLAYREVPLAWEICIDLFPYYRVGDGGPAHWAARARFLVLKRMLGVTLTFYEKKVKPTSRVIRRLPVKLRQRLALALLESLRRHQKEGADVFALCRGGKFLQRRWIEGPRCTGVFEGRAYPLPADHHAFLTAMFGDYMVLPPEDQRRGHELRLGDILWDTGKSYRLYGEGECRSEHQRKAPCKKKLLVVFQQNHIGGAMTALVNFLNALNTDRYQVDLLFYEIRGRVEGIKPEIHILPPARKNRPCLRRLLDPAWLAGSLGALYWGRVRGKELLGWQLFSRQACRYARRLPQHYDLAVAFELNWPFYYMMRCVRAGKKLVWHHNDYHAIGYRYDWDRRDFEQADGLVFVSRACRDKFAALHPSLGPKCWFMPNLMAKEPVVARAWAFEAALPFELVRPGLNLVTVARIYFSTKGLDRMIGVLTRLRVDGLLDRVRWLVIGKGDDLPRFRQMIGAEHLEQVVYPVGAMENPLPYLLPFDAFLLPSRSEGKPMAVTEAQILGLPPIVTRYASASEQVEDGVDGFIVENNDEALYQGLRDLILHPHKLERARQVLRSRSYTNEGEIACFDRMVEALEQEKGG